MKKFIGYCLLIPSLLVIIASALLQAAVAYAEAPYLGALGVGLLLCVMVGYFLIAEDDK